MPNTLQGFKAELFKALAHPARIRILELLRAGEKTVSELQALLEMESSTVSQQLALLRARHIVVGRKQGTSVHYSVVDPLMFDLLDVARRIFDNHLVDLQAAAGVADEATPTDESARSDAAEGRAAGVSGGSTGSGMVDSGSGSAMAESAPSGGRAGRPDVMGAAGARSLEQGGAPA